MEDQRWVVKSDDLGTLQSARNAALTSLEHHGDPDADYDACALAISELLSNAVRHGPGGDVELSLTWRAQGAEIAVRDAGTGFSLRISLPERTAEGGRGLFLISRLVGRPNVVVDASGCTVSVVLPVTRSQAAGRV